MSIKKIVAFTGIRSDYDLMSGLYRKIASDSDMELGLIVSGAHLSETYGYTVQYIENDDVPILDKIETLIDSDSPSSRVKSAAILLQCCIHSIEKFKPSVIIYAGDREDAMVGALVGAYLKIPSIHFFGGDHTVDGNVDNPVRHAISKLSSLHFVSHHSHVERLVKMGEPKRRIYNIGSPALDKFYEEPLIEKNELLKIVSRPEWIAGDYAIVIFHPILGQEENSGGYFEDILTALKELGIKAFVGYPNIDSGNKKIIEVIKRYLNDRQYLFYENFSRNIFINMMRHASFMIGNSSAGIVESPIIPLGVVNVGSRQKGRYAASNVIFVEQSHNEIKKAIKTVLSAEFKEKLKFVESPYGDGKSVDKAYNLIKSLDIESFKYKTEDPLVNE